MLHVATVMAPREVFRLKQSHADSIAEALKSLGRKPLSVTWLGEQSAFDLTFEGKAATDHEILASAGLRSFPIDVVVQPLAGRAKTLFIADMDSTIICEECIDEVADVLGLKEKVAAITEAAMHGKLDFKTALKKRVGLLKGISRTQLQAVYQDRITTAPGARTLIKTLKSAGIQTALVSGGFTFFTDQVKDALGFDFVRANQLGFSGDRLDGTVKEPLMDARGKKDFLEELAKGSPQAVLAIGDGANDIPMLKAAGMSLAYHGKPVAEKAARARLTHVDLTGVLYTLGIMEKAFQR